MGETVVQNVIIQQNCIIAIFRFLWGPPCIEIYPGDGSTLRATSSAAHFFTHYIMVNEQV